MRWLGVSSLILLFLVAIAGAEDNVSSNNSVGNSVNLGGFSSDVVYWSDETKKYAMGKGSKLDIDEFCRVTDYNLGKGYIVVECSRTVPIVIADVFSGMWIRTKALEGITNFTLKDVEDYSGLRTVVVASPWGFALLKERVDPLYFEDYIIAVLKSEMAKFSWEVAIKGLMLFMVGFTVSYYLKRERLLIDWMSNFILVVLIASFILLMLSIDISDRQISMSKEKIKDMYNWMYAVLFVLGYFVAMRYVDFEKLYLALAEYGRIKLFVYPFLPRKNLVRDVDGRLAKIGFKDEFKQPIDFEINGKTVRGVISIGIENKEIKENVDFNVKYSLIGFFVMLVISVVSTYLNVYVISVGYAFLLAFVIALLVNLKAIINRFSLEVEREKLVECSQVMREDSYTKMLKDAEIKHIAEDYNRLLRQLIKEKVLQPRRVISELLSTVKEVREIDREKVEKKVEGDKDDKNKTERA